MTTVTLSGTLSAGYPIKSGVTSVLVLSTALVGPGALTDAYGPCAIDNRGRVLGGGISLAGAGSVSNGLYGSVNAYISGLVTGVSIVGVGTVVNDATIIAFFNSGANGGVVLNGGGTVVNGANYLTSARILGGDGVNLFAASVVRNFGTIVGGSTFGAGVSFNAGGTLTNGSSADRAALILGEGSGVVANGAAITATNFGSILADGGAYTYGFFGGGRLTNGSPTDATAEISGFSGVSVSGTVANFGTILAFGQYAAANPYADYVGVAIDGVLVNGSGVDTRALISSAYGFGVESGGTVTNYATIEGGTAGVRVGAGELINGGGADRSALIEGADGVREGFSATTVHNYGTVLGAGVHAGYGVGLAHGGLFTNGSPNNTVALTDGYTGFRGVGAMATNFGTVRGDGDFGGDGVWLTSGAVFVNGAVTDAVARVSGYVGAYLRPGDPAQAGKYGHSTLDNFGTVAGVATAVSLGYADTLKVEPNCVFIGSVLGGGGTLELAAGAGTLTGLFAGGNVTVSGSMATTTFNTFAAVQIDAKAGFTLTGGAVIGAGQTLAVAGTVAGSGTVAVTGGAVNFTGSPAVTIATVSQSGGVVTFATINDTIADTWTQTAGTITAVTGDRVNFAGAGDVFSGALAGAGTIEFTGGGDLISGATLSGTRLVLNGASVTLAGAIAMSGTLTATAPNLTVAAGGASLTGAGSLILTNAASNLIVGASPAATLTNAVRIQGAGDIGGGQMTLVNQAGGVIHANQTLALILDTGANTVFNAGTLETTAAGGLTIMSAVNNSGALTVTAGTLLVNGAVSGAGMLTIGGGVADFASTFTEKVNFTGATGVLELSHSQGYAGQVTGFSKSGGTSLDLLDIAFAAGTTTATYSGTTASGVLTVTDGTHTARIHLTGDYTASVFTPASDGHGGTSVVDPTASPTGRTPPMSPLVNAMAGFGGGAGATSAPASELWRGAQVLLAVQTHRA